MNPYYAGGLIGYFYEVIWVWSDRWMRGGNQTVLTHYSVDDPCGAFSPLGLQPWFYSSPPYRIYEVWRWLNNSWMRCLSIRNWE